MRIVLVLSLVLVVLGCSNANEVPRTGAELYKAYCATCHGASGRGDGPSAGVLPRRPFDFTNRMEMAKRSDADLGRAIDEGVSPSMPAWRGTINDAERAKLVQYLRSFAE